MRFLVALITLLPLVAIADPLASCTNLGFSDGTGYTITGTTYNICSGCGDGETVADVNGLSLSPGDAVLFKAGEVFTIPNKAGRLNLSTGVVYGRYGAGANPIIRGPGASSGDFWGLVEGDGDDNLYWDGIDVDDAPEMAIMLRNVDSSVVRRSTITDAGGGGINFIGGTDGLAEYNVLRNNIGRPHESIAMTGGHDGYVVRFNRIESGGHAAINNKGNTINGEVYQNELVGPSDDPTMYIERAENIHIHDNWIRNATGTLKPLLMFGMENLDPNNNTLFNRNIEVDNNVIEGHPRECVNFWIKFDVIAPDVIPIFDNIRLHHNTIYDCGNEGQSHNFALQLIDTRSPNPDDDWNDIVIENNIFWDTNVADAIDVHSSVPAAEVIRRYNLFETGEGGGADLGTNAIFTGTAPFVDLANKNFDPAGAAIGAGSDGSDVGATIEWTCGLAGGGGDPGGGGTLPAVNTSKPDPYTVDAGEPPPDHLWVFSDDTAGVVEDEGSGTDCDLTLTGPDQGSDVFGPFYSFLKGNSDIARNASCTPPSTVGIMCAIFEKSGNPAATETIISFGNSADAFQVAAINITTAGEARSAVCPAGACGGNLNPGPIITNGELNMVCARQSATQNDLWVNDSGWQPSTHSLGNIWSGMDQVTIGAQGRSADDQYATADVYAAFMIYGDRSDAQMTALWNSRNPWPMLGIDEGGGAGEPTVPASGESYFRVVGR